MLYSTSSFAKLRNINDFLISLRNINDGSTFLQIDTAVRLLLPGELGKHAMCEGKKAVHAALA